MRSIITMIGCLGILASCQTPADSNLATANTTTDTLSTPEVIQPRVVSQPVIHDTDDPAIWINPNDEMQSLIIGTDKDIDGALFVWNLDGEIVDTTAMLQRPNNVDVGYGLMINGVKTDIAVTGERFTHNLRVFSLPEMKPIDGGGIPVFEGETGEEFRDLMGIAVWQNPNGDVHVIMGRKTGPTDGTYLWQYKLSGKKDGTVGAELVRKFGQFSGTKEIEGITVDNAFGYIYYNDEQEGMRKYHADPEKGNEELAFFAKEGYLDDNEGVTIYELTDTTGYIIVSDQARNAFRIYAREGSGGNPHNHPEIGVFYTATNNCDGVQIVTNSFGGKYPGGLMVAMSDNKTFQFYSWDDLAKGQFESVK